MTQTTNTVKTIPAYTELPELEGSPKQIKWAEDIRRRAYDLLVALVKGEDQGSDRYQVALGHVESWMSCIKAAWWIDNRGSVVMTMRDEVAVAEHKVNAVSNDEIAALERAGFSRWTKAGKDRLYINASALGLKCEYKPNYPSKIAKAWYGDEQITITKASGMKFAKTYIDVVSGKIYSDIDQLKQDAEALYKAVISGTAA